VEVDLPVAQEGPDDREGLLEAGDPVVEREAEAAVLGLVPAGTEPDDQPAVGDLVDRGGELREHRRRMEARRGDERPDLDPRGDRGDPSEGGPGLPGAARLAVLVAVEEVVAEPDRVEPDRLRGHRHRAQLRPADDPLDLGELDADLQGSRHGGNDTRPARPDVILGR
jgi:hypothetical protein